MTMFRGCRHPVIWLQNVVVDLLLGLGFDDAFAIFAHHVRARYGAEPGFITMNLPHAARRPRRRRASRTRSSAPTSTRSASGCPAGIERVPPRARGAPVPRRRDVGVRLRGDPAARGASSGSSSSRTSSRSSSARPAARAHRVDRRDREGTRAAARVSHAVRRPRVQKAGPAGGPVRFRGGAAPGTTGTARRRGRWRSRASRMPYATMKANGQAASRKTRHRMP